MRPSKPILLYGFPLSGHSHRAKLMLRLLDLPFDFHQVDLAGGEQRSESFLRLNPFGTVPVIEDDGVVVADSCAILVYLATKYDADGLWLPRDAEGAAQVQRWLSVAQGPVFNGPCSARLVTVFGMDFDHARAKAVAERLFTTLDALLAKRTFLVNERPTIADVALYSYIAHAPEGGVALTPHAHLVAWLRRIEALPGFAPMPATKAGLLAA
ncbi:glutathione S-transferase [Rhodoblastus sp.]|jgi:glutathione S-transferase|uniref:glutathione S-transferase family protein n=1 Tax=Rhodoblastus sp. TaxID=1962975 RepID=UPI0025E60BF3|nr:glutathione S-transferase [Rhodoblastus sp.]